METLRQSASRLVFVLSLVLVCGIQLLAQNPQTPPATETRTGCLTAGSRSGTYVLIVDVSGERLPVTGQALDAFRMDQKVTATGTTMRTGNAESFQATKIEPLNQLCQVGYTDEMLKRSIGHARIGIRGGVSFDPEMINVGAQAEFGPLFKTLWVRPTAEYAFGEVTQVASLSPEVIYYLPFTGYGRNGSRWNTYVGGGPTVGFTRRNFEGFPDNHIEGITDWDTDWGMNIFFGMAQQSGAFFEIKGTAWAVPAVRLYLGYAFK